MGYEREAYKVYCEKASKPMRYQSMDQSDEGGMDQSEAWEDGQDAQAGAANMPVSL